MDEWMNEWMNEYVNDTKTQLIPNGWTHPTAGQYNDLARVPPLLPGWSQVVPW